MDTTRRRVNRVRCEAALARRAVLADRSVRPTRASRCIAGRLEKNRRPWRARGMAALARAGMGVTDCFTHLSLTTAEAAASTRHHGGLHAPVPAFFAGAGRAHGRLQGVVPRGGATGLDVVVWLVEFE